MEVGRGLGDDVVGERLKFERIGNHQMIADQEGFLKVDLGELKEEMTALEEEMKGFLEEGMKGLEEGMTGLEEGMTDLWSEKFGIPGKELKEEMEGLEDRLQLMNLITDAKYTSTIFHSQHLGKI